MNKCYERSVDEHGQLFPQFTNCFKIYCAVRDGYEKDLLYEKDFF